MAQVRLAMQPWLALGHATNAVPFAARLRRGGSGRRAKREVAAAPTYRPVSGQPIRLCLASATDATASRIARNTESSSSSGGSPSGSETGLPV
jgi:hypothetical protein